MRKVWLEFRGMRREMLDQGLWRTRLAIGVGTGETYRGVWRRAFADAVREAREKAGQAQPPPPRMSTTGAVLLDRILQDVSRAVSATAFLIALRQPEGLRIPAPPLDFWQHELKSWVRADYGNRLEQVLRAYQSLRPGDLRPS